MRIYTEADVAHAREQAEATRVQAEAARLAMAAAPHANAFPWLMARSFVGAAIFATSVAAVGLYVLIGPLSTVALAVTGFTTMVLFGELARRERAKADDAILHAADYLKQARACETCGNPLSLPALMRECKSRHSWPTAATEGR